MGPVEQNGKLLMREACPKVVAIGPSWPTGIDRGNIFAVFLALPLLLMTEGR